MGRIEGDQVGERLRVRLACHRVRTVDVGLEVRRDVGLELAQERRELVDGRRQVDVGRVDHGRTLGLERGDRVGEDRLDDRSPPTPGRRCRRARRRFDALERLDR